MLRHDNQQEESWSGLDFRLTSVAIDTVGSIAIERAIMCVIRFPPFRMVMNGATCMYDFNCCFERRRQ